VRINANIWPEVLIREQGKAASAQSGDGWLPLAEDPATQLRPEDKTVAKANARLVDDWLAAIGEGREPVCSGFNGMKALEMALAVFEAGLAKTRVPLPLSKRTHPLV
jgi:predicted dehydrogenase